MGERTLPAAEQGPGPRGATVDGAAGRIGIIYPSDGVLDHEFWQCAPPGVAVHITRSPIPQASDPTLTPAQRLCMMADSSDLEAAAETFSLIGAGCVSYACTGASFARGVGSDTDIVRRIAAASGSPASTTTTAVVAALQQLGVRRVAVAAPYVEEVCGQLRSYFEGSGFEIVNLVALGLADGMEISAVSGSDVFELSTHADTPEAEGLFISCTALPTLDVLDDLEQHLGKPVVSANQATMWHALQVAGIPARLEGLGRLYRQ